MLHNKDLEKQRNEILAALELSRSDLEVQRDDNSKYAPDEDVEYILSEIDNHLALIERSIELVNEWAVKIDSSISTQVF